MQFKTTEKETFDLNFWRNHHEQTQEKQFKENLEF